MPAEIIIFILTCLAVAAGLVLVTYWLTRARWHTRLDMASGANIRHEQEAATAAQSRLDAGRGGRPRREMGAPGGHRRGQAHPRLRQSAKAHDQKEVLGLALSVSQRGRVRVRIVDGEGGHHLLLHSPAGYKNKARATKILERLISMPDLLRVEDYEMVEEEDK